LATIAHTPASSTQHPLNSTAVDFPASGPARPGTKVPVVRAECLWFRPDVLAQVGRRYGGGTGLATQRECLELLGCYGPGQVRKFAEIVAATVLWGEISLGAAVVADEWVTAHERLGRNRP
jgi:hydroxymethylglutaryl-CoA reductase